MFTSARIKLTAWYLLIIMIVSISFSLFIYQLLSIEITRFARVQRIRIERRLDIDLFLPPPIDLELIADTQHRLALSLLVVNIAILATSGALGFFLAGRTLDPIQKMVDEQNRFISDSSHELRTPLTSLKSAMEVNLRDKKLTIAGARQLISESIAEVDKLQSLSDELLQLAQYQKPNGHSAVSTVSLDEVVIDAIQKINGLALKKNIIIKNLVHNINIKTHKFSLTDLFVILLDNAIKYSPSGKKVIVSAKQFKNSVEISVKDFGIGIDPLDLPYVFDRFYRAESSRTKTDIGGYGLGLSIAKKIIDNQHGSVKVDSILGKGTTFIIKLPKNYS